jgi:hypothetical protein
VASIERTAYPRFKRVVPVRELHEAFTPAAGEIAWAREQTRTPEHLLARGSAFSNSETEQRDGVGVVAGCPAQA